MIGSTSRCLLSYDTGHHSYDGNDEDCADRQPKKRSPLRNEAVAAKRGTKTDMGKNETAVQDAMSITNGTDEPKSLANSIHLSLQGISP
jgi:hypothetical protein